MSDQQRPAFAVPASPTHEPLPVRGTIKRAKNGEPLAYPIQARDYPIIADCSDCEKSVRKDSSMFSDWEHVE